MNVFYIQCGHVANIIKTAQHPYYKKIIHENCNDYKAIYKIVNSLLFRKSDSPMPDIKPLSLLAEGFNEFFYTKIANIIDKLKLNVPTHNPNKFIEDEYKTEKRIGILVPVSHMDVINMVKSVPPKSCKLDPIPTKILKDHIDAIAQGIANIINTSFKHGYVCDSLKDAILRPLLKLPKLDLDFSNFRPVSNLAYLSKLAKRFVSQQLMRYAEVTDMLEPFQSAYRQGFSTETAQLWVKTDILDVIDRKEVTWLVMLELSAAFDTISDKLSINHLKYHFGITDTIVQWISSYFTNRSQ